MIKPMSLRGGTTKQSRRFKIFLLLLLPFAACKQHHSEQMTIGLVVDSVSVKITGLDRSVIQEINRDSVPDWRSLVPVYSMAADSDMKNTQSPQSGKYKVSDNAVVFTPDTPFVKDQTYFVRFYQYDEPNSVWDYIRKKKKAGKPQFVDLIFKR